MGQRIRLDVFVWAYIPFLILLPAYTYYMATIKEKVVPKFPWATVTDTACPYPQDILFRFGMLTATSFMSLLYYALFRYEGICNVGG
jgi:hypothetical protein